jgi:DinB superfamily
MEFKLAHATEILSRTPMMLNSLMRDLPEPWLVRNEGPETWSPYDIVGHLIHGEETDWIPRAKIILEHGETRPFEPFDRFAMFEKSKGKTIAELLDTFARLRAENLRELQMMNLTPELLQKRGTHPELGVVTMKQLLAAWVVHDLGHVRQVVRVMAKQYRDEVGPWTAYLAILGRDD